jgi:uncharacterized protein YcaQ
MNNVVKITYHYDNGSTLDITREHDYERHRFEWAKGSRRSAEEQKEHDDEVREIVKRLNNVDPSIFPKNLFKTEEE